MELRNQVRKAVITAAGWGTRFLPATKAQPKEMLPLVDKPMIQYVVEEAVASGIEQLIIVTALGKRAIEDHFDRSLELEISLEARGETKLLASIQHISELADICYVRQKEPLGLGHAVLTARNLVGNEPFAVLLPDDIIAGPTPALSQLIDVYHRFRCSVLAVEQVPHNSLSSYGVILPRTVEERVYRVEELVEKPDPEEAPSDLGVVGRYVLTPEVFDALADTTPGKGGEIQLTDGLRRLLEWQAVYARQFEGTRYDAGTPLGFLKASVELALRREDIGPAFRAYLKALDPQ
ncbi:MAG: UTP--glucose-1-phosphate uridylyltransferase GalU [Chloroflexi bacterium]|nr:UTP--glucose-1-phosphate uridylyltransferase GalU [Chloroflexota bacterium]